MRASSLRSTVAIGALLTACVCAACGSTGGAGSQAAPRPTFVHGARNPWFPLQPGTTFVYTGEKDGQAGRDVVRVTGRKRTIRGVRCAAVADRLYLKGL